MSKNKKIKSKNYYGFVNELPFSDKRISKFIKQHKKRGFDDTETWNLNTTILRFTLPRLKRFRDINVCMPLNLELDDETLNKIDFEDGFLSIEEWNEKLDKMINAIELYIKNGVYEKNKKGEIEEGFDLFFKYFFDLWW